MGNVWLVLVEFLLWMMEIRTVKIVLKNGFGRSGI